MLRSQTIQPVPASVKTISWSASSTGLRRCSQCSPPSEVASSAPFPPTAQPLDSSTKKTECSHANVPVCCFFHGVCAETLREKVNSTASVSERVASPDGNVCLGAATRSPTLAVLFRLLMSEAAGEDAREAYDGERLQDLIDGLPLVAGDEDLVAGAQEVVVGRSALLDGGHVNRHGLQHPIRVEVEDDDLLAARA